MELDVAGDDAAQRAHDLVHAQRVGHAYRVGDADARHADLVHLAVDGEQIDQVAAEAVLAGEPDLQAVALDELDHLDGRLDDLADVASVREPPQQAGGPEQDVQVLDAQLVQEGGDLHLVVRREERVGELLALAQGRLDDREIVQAHGDVRPAAGGNRITVARAAASRYDAEGR